LSSSPLFDASRARQKVLKEPILGLRLSGIVGALELLSLVVGLLSLVLDLKPGTNRFDA
jgi:hypothetical protein